MTSGIFLGLGTNLGDRARNLARARSLLPPQVVILAVSPIYETEPWGLKEQPRFLNQVVQVHTTLPPQALLDYLKAIERRMGRDFQQVRYGPRVIDLDILAYEDRIVNTAQLQVPHPRLEQRAFVLIPWADLAPQWRHPVTGQTLTAMLAHVDTTGVRAYPQNGRTDE